MNIPPASSEITAEQQWLAARYVWGELSEEESLAFEAQLADNLQLCALVADESLLSEAIRAAESLVTPKITHPARPTARTDSGWAGQLLCATTALLVLVTAWWAWSPLSAPPAVVHTAPEVLDAWTALDEGPAHELVSAEDESATDFAMGDLETGAVPDWLLAAVAASPDQAETAITTEGGTL